MRKLLLLSACGLMSLAAGAQQTGLSVARAENFTNTTVKTPNKAVFAGDKITQSRFHNSAKATAAPFYNENFSTGTRTTLPTGWTATAGPSQGGATWHWTNTASTGSFGIGALNSTTASNGWMIFDSDSIGTVFPSTNPILGSLISPSLSCTGHSSVLLAFQEYFTKFQDSCFVDVSNDGGVNWTAFPVTDNNNLSSNNNVPTNPYTVRINISSVAANQANVKLRFRYVGRAAGGSYNWLLDDIALSELDPVELGIGNSAMVLFLGGTFNYSNYSLFSNYPVQLVDSMFPLTWVSNNGSNAATNLVVNAQVFQGATSVYNQNATLPTIPSGGKDSLVAWDDIKKYKPTSVGSYSAAFSINPANDALASNNIDSARFNITDTVLTTYGPTVSGSYYIHKPSSLGELSYYMGARFDIPAGKSDTLTSVSVSYANGTTAGVNTVVQIYKVTGTTSLSWAPVGSMRPKTLAAGDISTTTTRVYTNYMANTSGGVSQFILPGGTYAAVVTTIGAAPASTVLITAATPINNNTTPAGYFGQSDTSKNTAGYEFGADPSTGVATGMTAVPLIRINFANKVTGPGPGSVASITGVQIGDAYPNPANTTISVPVATTIKTNVTVSLYNMMGQIVMSQDLPMGANQKQVATFNTANLANGTYLYSVEANGDRVANRVVVSH